MQPAMQLDAQQAAQFQEFLRQREQAQAGDPLAMGGALNQVDNQHIIMMNELELGGGEEDENNQVAADAFMVPANGADPPLINMLQGPRFERRQAERLEREEKENARKSKKK